MKTNVSRSALCMTLGLGLILGVVNAQEPSQGSARFKPVAPQNSTVPEDKKEPVQPNPPKVVYYKLCHDGCGNGYFVPDMQLSPAFTSAEGQSSSRFRPVQPDATPVPPPMPKLVECYVLHYDCRGCGHWVKVLKHESSTPVAPPANQGGGEVVPPKKSVTTPVNPPPKKIAGFEPDDGVTVRSVLPKSTAPKKDAPQAPPKPTEPPAKKEQ